MKETTDAEIEKGLNKNHLFDETQACAVIAGLIAKQPNGEEGVLLNSSHANLFYTGSYVVYVSWDSDDRGWSVDTWERDRSRRNAGRRVFSPDN